MPERIRFSFKICCRLILYSSLNLSKAIIQLVFNVEIQLVSPSISSAHLLGHEHRSKEDIGASVLDGDEGFCLDSWGKIEFESITHRFESYWR